MTAKAAAGNKPAREIILWRNGVLTSYLTSGICLASWLSRIPALRDDLSLTPAIVGLLLLCMSVGSFASVFVSGAIVYRVGPKLTIRYCSTMVVVGLIVMGIGATIAASEIITGTGLLIIGLGSGCWNVSSNVEGAEMERSLKKHIMPALHGSFSLGTVIGAGLGTLAALVHLPVLMHLGAVAIVTFIAMWAGTKYFRGHISPSSSSQTPPAEPRTTYTGEIPVISQELADKSLDKVDKRGRVSAAWREPRTLLIGLMVLSLALGEGAAGDWIALAMADGHGVSNALGAAAYGLFVLAMTFGRFTGVWVITRCGRVLAIRLCVIFTVVGLLLFIFSPWTWLAIVAVVLWGVGVSLAFPIGTSAAADEPVHATARVSVVSTLGYAAFLGGPPLLGLLANQVGILHSLLVVAVLVTASFFIAGYTKKIGEDSKEMTAK